MDCEGYNRRNINKEEEMGKKGSLYGLIAWLGIGIWLIIQLIQIYFSRTMAFTWFEILLVSISIISIFFAIVFNRNRKNSFSHVTLVITILSLFYSLVVLWVGSILD